MKLLLLLLFLGATHGNWLMSWVENKATDKLVSMLGFPTNDDCEFTRTDALKCLEKHVDRNHNGFIDPEEFDYVKQHYMPERMKRLMWVTKKLGWDYTLRDVLKVCDADKDGRFSLPSDWLKSEKTCLPLKADLCKVQHICSIADKKEK